MLRKNLVLTYQKWLLASEISVFLNCQYFTNTLLSGFEEFWHVDRHE